MYCCESEVEVDMAFQHDGDLLEKVQHQQLLFLDWSWEGTKSYYHYRGDLGQVLLLMGG